MSAEFGRKSPAQTELLKKITEAGKAGVPLDKCHTATVEGLMRRGLVTVWYGRVIPIERVTW